MLYEGAIQTVTEQLKCLLKDSRKLALCEEMEGCVA